MNHFPAVWLADCKMSSKAHDSHIAGGRTVHQIGTFIPAKGVNLDAVFHQQVHLRVGQSCASGEVANSQVPIPAADGASARSGRQHEAPGSHVNFRGPERGFRSKVDRAFERRRVGWAIVEVSKAKRLANKRIHIIVVRHKGALEMSKGCSQDHDGVEWPCKMERD